MSEQITIPQVRETKILFDRLVPILNQDELVELMRFHNRVLWRYAIENYPDGLPEDE